MAREESQGFALRHQPRSGLFRKSIPHYHLTDISYSIGAVVDLPKLAGSKFLERKKKEKKKEREDDTQTRQIYYPPDFLELDQQIQAHSFATPPCQHCPVPRGSLSPCQF